MTALVGWRRKCNRRDTGVFYWKILERKLCFSNFKLGREKGFGTGKSSNFIKPQNIITIYLQKINKQFHAPKCVTNSWREMLNLIRQRKLIKWSL